MPLRADKSDREELHGCGTLWASPSGGWCYHPACLVANPCLRSRTHGTLQAFAHASVDQSAEDVALLARHATNEASSSHICRSVPARRRQSGRDHPEQTSRDRVASSRSSRSRSRRAIENFQYTTTMPTTMAKPTGPQKAGAIQSFTSARRQRSTSINHVGRRGRRSYGLNDERGALYLGARLLVLVLGNRRRLEHEDAAVRDRLKSRPAELDHLLLQVRAQEQLICQAQFRPDPISPRPESMRRERIERWRPGRRVGREDFDRKVGLALALWPWCIPT